MVSNVGATLLGGEVFTNFSANAYSGAFASAVLPPLNSGLNWYLGHLTTNGMIRVNRKPVANPVTFTNEAPNVLEIPIASLLANDTDPDGDPLSLSGISLITTNGVSLVSSGSVLLYSNYVSVVDQFTYMISDGRGGTASGTVNIAPSRTGRFASHGSGNGESMTLHFVGNPGWTYYIERSIDLPFWVAISTNVAPASGLFDYTDDFRDLPESPEAAFYRLRWSP